MILLDTNVISAVMMPAPPGPVLRWLNEQETTGLYLSAITLAEIGHGLRVLPDRKRRRDLEDRFARFIAEGSNNGFCGSTRRRRSSTARSWRIAKGWAAPLASSTGRSPRSPVLTA